MRFNPWFARLLAPLLFLALAGQARAATPVVQYLFTEASSGTIPTTTADAAPGTAVTLTMSNGASGVWTANGHGNGYNCAGTGTATKSGLSGSKLQTALSGVTQASFEFEISTVSTANQSPIYLGNTSLGGAVFWVEVSNTGSSLEILIGPANYQFNYTSGDHVYAVLFDSNAAAGSRIKLWTDGTQITGGGVNVLTEVTAGAVLDVSAATWSTNELQIGAAASIFNFIGSVYYFAAYAGVLSGTDVTAHSTSIASNNDADPNVSAAPTYFGSTDWFDFGGGL